MSIVSGDGNAPADITTLEERYELVREIGRGASALVYLARERTTGQLVAIKAIRGEFAQDPEVAGRFEREARTAAALDHPNIARIYAVARLAGRALAIVMQYVPGGTLRDALSERELGQFSFEETERVLRDVATALAYAHRQGVVHRDVKPGNIFLEEGTGRAVLADFGIARSLDGDQQLTMEGSAIGTPTYMSPEQIDGASIDGRSDLYSLGLVGWEMLAGQRPWEGESLYNVIYKQKHQRLPRLDELRPGIPAPLLFAIEGALLKRREDRWANAEEFLQRLSTEEPGTRPVPSLPAPRTEPDTPTVVFRRPGADDASTGGVVTLGPARASAAALPVPVARAPLAVPPRAAPRPAERLRSRIPLLLWLALPLLFVLGIVLARAREGRRARSSTAQPTAPATPATRVTPPVVATSGGAVDGKGVADSVGSRTTDDSIARPFGAGDIAPDTRGPPGSTPASSVAVTTASSTSTAPAPVRRATLPSGATSSPRSEGLRRCSSPAAADQRACLAARLARHDEELNRVYNQLIAGLRRRAGGRAEPPDVVRLRAEQRAWLRQRDIECQRQGRGREGALWAPVRAACLGEIADSRAAELRERLEGL